MLTRRTVFMIASEIQFYCKRSMCDDQMFSVFFFLCV